MSFPPRSTMTNLGATTAPAPRPKPDEESQERDGVEGGQPGPSEEANVPNEDRFSQEEEDRLVDESTTLKAQAKAFYTAQAYPEALEDYQQALALCPIYRTFEVALINSNIALCHVKLERWADAVAAASETVNKLNALEKEVDDAAREASRETTIGTVKVAKEGGEEGGHEEIEEIITPRARGLTHSTRFDGHSRKELRQLRIKALLRRGTSRCKIGGWTVLKAALEDDYTPLMQEAELLSAADRRHTREKYTTLPGLIERAKSKEMAEMMGKLKELGNGILKPFGLSTDNFSLTKDEATGGYSMQFNQGQGQGSSNSAGGSTGSQ